MFIQRFKRFSTQDVVRKIENSKTGQNDRPTQEVAIADSGDLPIEKPFQVEKDAVKE